MYVSTYAHTNLHVKNTCVKVHLTHANVPHQKIVYLHKVHTFHITSIQKNEDKTLKRHTRCS